MSSLLDLPRLDADPDAPFPPTSQALASPNGLLAWGGDLHPRRLLGAYRAGIFPWYSAGQPILWWSPAPRCVFYPGRVYISKRSRRRYNSGQFELSADRDFAAVIEACAQPRDDGGGTWITADMIDAYERLHETGHAHSVEVWQDGRLVGGIYGLALGSVFFGESMFSRASDAGKLALIALCRHLRAEGFVLLDCQLSSEHLLGMGAERISRAQFERELEAHATTDRAAGSWSNTARFEVRW
ncbi:MAG: leucyl/phenylalanyl-tRNA--protein transferase [Xanthomonadales bacterium]|nr:leucyl/phenylalanyl-tRNA--protein transferase [Xanthomonadales bacterium]